eukprot:2338610-Pleurochrysis_carterae.AAC.2
MPVTDRRRAHPLYGCPCEIPGWVKQALGSVAYLSCAQQEVVGGQCRRPLHPCLWRSSPSPLFQHRTKVLGAERVAQFPHALRWRSSCLILLNAAVSGPRPPGGSSAISWPPCLPGA